MNQVINQQYSSDNSTVDTQDQVQYDTALDLINKKISNNSNNTLFNESIIDGDEDHKSYIAVKNIMHKIGEHQRSKRHSQAITGDLLKEKDEYQEKTGEELFVNKNQPLDQSLLMILANNPDFKQFMQDYPQDNISSTAKQFIQNQAQQTHPNFVNSLELACNRIKVQLSDVANLDDLSRLNNDINEQMDAIIDIAINIVKQSQDSEPIIVPNNYSNQTNYTNGYNQDIAPNNNDSAIIANLVANGSALVNEMIDTNQTDSNTTEEYIDPENISATSIQNYTDLIDQKSTLNIIYLSLHLLISISDINYDLETINNQFTENTPSQMEALINAVDAFKNLNKINFPYKASDGKTYTDLYSLLNYAYDIKNSQQKDIDSLKNSLDNLYSQLNSENNQLNGISSKDWSFDNGKKFASIFTQYEQQINQNIKILSNHDFNIKNNILSRQLITNPPTDITSKNIASDDEMNQYLGVIPTNDELSKFLTSVEHISMQTNSTLDELKNYIDNNKQRQHQVIDAVNHHINLNIHSNNQILWN